MCALRAWFQDDLSQSITAITVAMLSASVANGATNVEYARGVIDTARAQALNYGIPWSGLVWDMCEVLGDAGRGDLLELVARALPGGET